MEENYLRKQLPIALIIYFGQMTVGYGLGWTAPIVPKLQDPEESPIGEVITETTASWIGSVFYIGCITGPHFTSFFSNNYGRKPCLMFGGFIMIISYILVILTQNLAMIFVVRVLKGFGIGIVFVSNIVYIGEMASTSIRGTLVTIIGVASTLGLTLCYVTGPFVSFAGTGWIGLGISLASVGTVVLIPESPVFHVIKGNEEEARRILISLGRTKEIGDVLATKIEKKEKSMGSDWKELFTVRSNRRALTILMVILALQSLSGNVIMMFFATTIFELAGSSIKPHIATIIIGVTQVASSIVTPVFVDRSGRKMLLLISTSVCCLSLVVLGGYFFVYENGYAIATKVGWLPLVCMVIFFFFYQFGLEIIPPTLTAEMFRSNVRSTGAAFTTTAGWLAGFAVSSAFGYMLAIGGHYTFWFFAAACACAAFFTAFYVPETKGKTLLEIQEMLEK